MTDERYHFDDDGSSYNANNAAEHLVRYHAVRELCAGKRVLDVACGEGYGSYLLASWGAERVVGIDVATNAIDVAQRIFAHPNVTYLAGDACRLSDILGEGATFDLVVSFETIEHVADVEGLLRGLAFCRAPGGTIVISCPNDHAGLETNPFHLRTYTLEEFQQTTTAVLGPASEWRLGAPLQGQVLYDLGTPVFEHASGGPESPMMRWKDVSRTVMIPAQPDIAPEAGTCRFYLGSWGVPCGTRVVVAAMSYPAFVGPWREAQFLNAEIGAAVRSLPASDAHESSAADLPPASVADLHRRIASQASRHAAEIAGLQAEAGGLRDEIGALRVAADAAEVLRRDLVDRLRVCSAKVEESEEALTRLREERTEQDEQLADLRRRAIVYIRQGKELAADLAMARQENARLGAEVDHWQAVRASRSYRTINIYTGAYNLPIVGHCLRWLRRGAGRAARAVRRRVDS